MSAASLAGATLAAWLCATAQGHGAKRWTGVDDGVVVPIARAGGRAPWRPLLPGDQGDLGLFAFLCAGLVAGGVLGYALRAFLEPGQAAPRGGTDDR